MTFRSTYRDYYCNCYARDLKVRKNRKTKVVCATSIQPLEADVIFHYKFTENFCLAVTSAGSPVSPICVASQALRLREKQTHTVAQLRKYSQLNE